MLRSTSQRALFAGSLFVLAGGAVIAAVGTGHGFRLNGKVKAGKVGNNMTLVVTQQLLKPWTPEVYLPGRPVDMAFNADKSKLAIMNTREINLIDEKTGKIQDIRTAVTSYCGIAFRPDGKEIWVSEAARKASADAIAILPADGKGAPTRIKLKKFTLPAGMAFSKDGSKVYVAMNGSNTIAVIDASSHKIEKEIPVGLAPLFVKLSPDGNTLYVSNRGGRVPTDPKHIGLSAGVKMAVDDYGAVLEGTVSVINLASGDNRQITVGRAPSGLALSDDGKLLAVANAHSDSVTIMNTANGKLQTVSIPTMPDRLIGTLPTGAVFSPDAQRLYVTAGLNNSVVVLDRKGDTYSVSGAVPTGWFPSTIAIDGHGQLAVLNIKGRGNTKAETLTVSPKDGPIDEAYNTHSFEGSLMRLPVLKADQLKQATDFVVAANNPTFDTQGGIADLSKLGIKHVILIVKENRTYDQVLGDMGKGNGEPRFAFYGKEVTPNEHALAAKYVLLDNFYATGAISFDGHQWLEQGFVSDNMERSTSGPRGYAYNLNDALDVSPSGVFWEHQTRPLDVKIGGVLSTGVKLAKEDKDEERVQGDIDEVKAADWMRNYKLWEQGKWRGLYGSKAAVPMLQRFEDSSYPAGGAAMPDQVRASYVEDYMAEAEKKNHLPDLLVWGMGGDHTMGTRPGAPSPKTMVADNDLAVGRVVEAVSKSKFWPDTLIFIVEDDAQNGTDHVDGHRTVALAIGPMIKRNAIDSNFYTQVSLTRTIQDILGITPSTHFLKAARPMSTIFTTQKDVSVFTHLKNTYPLDIMNPNAAALSGQAKKDALLSARMNWNDFDDVPEQTLNRILWANAKGYDVPMPAPKHAIPNNIH